MRAPPQHKPKSEEVQRNIKLLTQLAADYRADVERRLASVPRKPDVAAKKVNGDANAVVGDENQIDLERIAEEWFLQLRRRSLRTPLPSRSESVEAEAACFHGIDEKEDGALVIFDWDDTLFPTWFLQAHILPTMDGPGTLADAKLTDLPADSQYHQALRYHARVVRSVLMAARAVARVAIVTLALRPWVLNSADNFLPGLDLRELLLRLEIPIFYAREHVRRPDTFQAQLEEGVDVFTVAKRASMKKCLRKMYSKDENGHRKRMNVVSVGDSLAEKDAVKDVIWSYAEKALPGQAPICKTVKLLNQPTISQLGDELQLLTMWLRRMPAHMEDLDVSMDNPADLRRRVHDAFFPTEELTRMLRTLGHQPL